MDRPPPGPRRPPTIRHDPPIPLGSCAGPNPCRFHDPTTGTCRRHAPMRLNIAGHPEACWPRVDDTSWCGKWEPPLPGDHAHP